MKTFKQVYSNLCRKNRKNYTLLAACILLSVMLITSFVSIINAPTVLAILPKGGDSRRQVIMIFVLGVVGCCAFVTYAASLFFRFKSRETGIFMILGASKKFLKSQITKELLFIGIISCLVGALLGTPLAWLIWQLFRLFLVDTKEMALSFDPKSYMLSVIFSLFVIIMLLIMSTRFLRRTNIIDIVNEQHKSEPIHDIKSYYGPLGILLIGIGGFGGYIAPSIFKRILHSYAVSWAAVFYLPLFIGIYMVLMHTIINGWGHGKSRYKNIIPRSMMKFQGKQTVGNMLVITLLIAGAYFAAFYAPMLSTSSIYEDKKRPVDYAFHYLENQKMITKAQIEEMAVKYGVKITSYKETDFANLGTDGTEEVFDTNGKYHDEYHSLFNEGSFISQSSYNYMTGQNIDIQPKKFGFILKKDDKGGNFKPADTIKLTNMTTRKMFKADFQEYARYDMLTGYYILNDDDYKTITNGMKNEWSQKLIYFNVNNVKKTYKYAKELYNAIVDHSDPECALSAAYNRVEKIVDSEAHKAYWGDKTDGTYNIKMNYNMRDTWDFRSNWKYAPRFRVLDYYDFLTSFAVFLVLFMFIAIICFAAVLIIGYIRCITIAMNNRQVYEDIKHLGASPKYLFSSVRGQTAKVFKVPAVLGTSIIYILYCMILYFNDHQISHDEIASLRSCFFVVIVLSILIWAFYRFTLKKVCNMLNIKKA